MRFRNPRKFQLRRYKVDGCLIPKGCATRACDFLVIDPKRRGFFVELKGGDILHALTQLESSIIALRQHLEPGERILCFVICSGNRLPVATLTSQKERFRKRYNADLCIRTNQFEHSIE